MRYVALGLALAGALPLAGCGSTRSGEGGNVLANMLLYGGPTVPPAAPVATDEVYCPVVGVLDGGAALRAVAGTDPSAVRNQIALGQLARECNARPDGTIAVKVGVEGRALLGPGGGTGRFEAPVRIVVKRGETVIASRSRRVPIVIPPGDSQGSFAVVEDGFVVPAQFANDFEIEVGLGSAPSEPRARRRRG